MFTHDIHTSQSVSSVLHVSSVLDPLTLTPVLCCALPHCLVAEVSNFNIRITQPESESEQQQQEQEQEQEQGGSAALPPRLPHPTSMHLYNRGSQRGMGIYIGRRVCD